MDEKNSLPGPFRPILIIHGGAGNITRQNLSRERYDQYEDSLLKYLSSTRKLLMGGASALDASVHAVSLLEDDPLFNCGRGSVFTEAGTIEMEASVMVASLEPDRARSDASRIAQQKRGAAVSLLSNTRHPIQLAKEVLLIEPDGRTSSTHGQLSGPEVERWGWKERELERKDDDWFWTERRWKEHKRGLRTDNQLASAEPSSIPDSALPTLDLLPSQGTVGAVCMDSWGDVAVATSTGGLTNKKVGRIGDTPTFGAGFWAESWTDVTEQSRPAPQMFPFGISPLGTLRDVVYDRVGNVLWACLSPNLGWMKSTATDGLFLSESNPHRKKRIHSRAVALSGTGNGDSFLRTSACRTTAAICRYKPGHPTSKFTSLASAVSSVAGPGGELEKSAGDRWLATGEGEAGMIGIEVIRVKQNSAETTAVPDFGAVVRKAEVVANFNCGGLWRAWFDEKTGKEKVMVFRDDFY